MTKINDILVNKFKYFVEERHSGKIVAEQKGIMRTNCLDCLDRTNVTQTKIAMKIVETILDKVKQQNRRTITNEESQRLAMYGFDNSSSGFSSDAQVFDQLKLMWADNGDHLSK